MLNLNGGSTSPNFLSNNANLVTVIELKQQKTNNQVPLNIPPSLTSSPQQEISSIKTGKLSNNPFATVDDSENITSTRIEHIEEKVNLGKKKSKKN